MYLSCKGVTYNNVKVTNNDNKYKHYLNRETYKLQNLSKTKDMVAIGPMLVVEEGMLFPYIAGYNISS